ncbi:MAG: FHA domain-containing protein [Chloroflexi bacterium]|nr:FHA domain-containing protein [Chloroflexota bacterium]
MNRDYWEVLAVMECPNCKRQVPENSKICAYCGSLLEVPQTNTRALNDPDFEDSVPRWGTARFNARMNLVLTVHDTSTAFVFDAERIEELVIGRQDPTTGISPDIDLRDHGAVEKGVSRRHATIVRRNGSLSIVDQGSPNGTYLNGQRLIANQPRVLRDGDDVRLGHLVLRVTFERAATPNV